MVVVGSLSAADNADKLPSKSLLCVCDDLLLLLPHPQWGTWERRNYLLAMDTHNSLLPHTSPLLEAAGSSKELIPPSFFALKLWCWSSSSSCWGETWSWQQRSSRGLQIERKRERKQRRHAEQSTQKESLLASAAAAGPKGVTAL